MKPLTEIPDFLPNIGKSLLGTTFQKAEAEIRLMDIELEFADIELREAELSLIKERLRHERTMLRDLWERIETGKPERTVVTSSTDGGRPTRQFIPGFNEVYPVDGLPPDAEVTEGGE